MILTLKAEKTIVRGDLLPLSVFRSSGGVFLQVFLVSDPMFCKICSELFARRRSIHWTVCRLCVGKKTHQQISIREPGWVRQALILVNLFPPTFFRDSLKKIPRRQIQDLESFGCALIGSNYPPTVEIILWRKIGAIDG